MATHLIRRYGNNAMSAIETAKGSLPAAVGGEAFPKAPAARPGATPTPSRG